MFFRMTNTVTRTLALAVSLGAVALAGCGSKEIVGPVADARSAEEIRKSLLSSEAGAGGEQVAAATGTGWATVKGRFVFVGDPPTMPAYNVTKEQDICTEHGSAPKQEYLLVDGSTKGIKNVLVYLRTASRVHDSAKASSDKPVFDQKECKFLSHVFPVAVGESVDIKNSDPTGHNTKIGGKMNFNQTIASGASVAFPIQKAEATPAQVTCSIHPWMIAYILPRDNKYFAVTAADGTFEIPNIPAGEPVEIQVWHEHSVNPSGLFVNTPEAKALKWNNKGRFTVNVPEGQTLDLGEIKVPASAFKG
jgi:plastocyanin